MSRSMSLAGLIDELTRTAKRARDTFDKACAAMRAASDEVRAGSERIRVEATRALGGDGAVIDVGMSPSVLARAGRTAAALVVAALAISALVTFSFFFVQLLFALILATQVLGLRIDPAVLSQR